MATPALHPARILQLKSALLLMTGAGLVFLNAWARQDFELLLRWQADLAAGEGLTWLADPLLLALSLGLSPLSLLGGGALFVAGLRGRTGQGVPPAPEPDGQPAAGDGGVTGPANQAVPPEDVPSGPLIGARRPHLLQLSAWLRITPRQVAFLGLAILFAAAAGLAAGGGDHMRLPLVAALAWGLGVALAVLGGWRSERGWLRLDRRGLLIALGLGSIAFLIRIYQVEHIPLVLTGDEASMGLSAARFLEGAADNLFGMGWFSHPALFFYLQSKSIALFGRTILALRLPAALAGALTVSGVYLLGRVLFGGRTGLFAALFLAFLHYHIHFSRLGLNNAWDGLAYVAVLGFLWQGWRTGRRGWFLLAGLGLGLAQYFYVSSRMLLALVPLWLLAAGLLDRARLKRRLPDLFLMGVAALATVLPLAMFFSLYPGDYLWPIHQATVLSAEVRPPGAAAGLAGWLARLGEGFLAYTHAPLRFVWYTPGTPILRALPGTLFLLGVLLLALRPRDLRTWLLAGWIAAFGLAGGLSDYTPAAQRYVAAAPGLALVAGAGLEGIYSRLQGLWPGKARLLYLGLVVLFFAVGVDELHFYFISYAPFSARGDRNALVAHRLATALRNELPGTEVVFFGGERLRFGEMQAVRYLAPQVQGLDMTAPWGAPGNPKPAGERLLFVFLPETGAEVQPVQASYPGGKLSTARDAAGETLYRLYAYPSAEP